MLKFVMLLIGVCVMAPLVLLALLFSLPALPFLVGGVLLLKIVRPGRFRFGRSFASYDRAIAVPVSRRVVPVAPVVLVTFALAIALQIRFGGFSWPVELALGGAILVVASLWWIQHRISVRRQHRTSGGSARGVAQHDLHRLFEIERAADAEERRVLIVRELNRLTIEALRPDPTLRSTWPSVSGLSSIRDQVRLLRSSLVDPATHGLPETGCAGPPASNVLMSAIDALERYVTQFLRVRLIARDDLEQIRILVRDQRRLRAMQDEIVDQLQQVGTVPIAG